MRSSSTTAIAIGLSALLSNLTAYAFDKQTYLGGGLGIGHYDRSSSVAPALSLYGAYGLSDSFDGRLELSSSWLEPEKGSSRDFLNSAVVACTYKLDVIAWVPWAGMGLGVYQMSDALAGPKRSNVEPGVALLIGFDYAWSREYGLSLAIGLHALPFTDDSNVAKVRYSTALLRFERRWGW